MKKTNVIIGCIVLAMAILSASTVIYFRGLTGEASGTVATDEFSIPEASASQKEKSDTPYSLPESMKIKPPSSKAAEVIEEPIVSKPEDSVPPPAVTETTDQDGGVTQTPNWEAQKKLAPDTDLENPDKQPEYANSQAASSKSAASASSSSKAESSAASSKQSGGTPKNGDTKTVNGEKFSYFEGFGWVKNGGGNVQTNEHVPTTGEKVGY